jgi:hypothetical protein
VHQNGAGNGAVFVLPTDLISAVDDPGHGGNNEDDPDDEMEFLRIRRSPMALFRTYQSCVVVIATPLHSASPGRQGRWSI